MIATAKHHNYQRIIVRIWRTNGTIEEYGGQNIVTKKYDKGLAVKASITKTGGIEMDHAEVTIYGISPEIGINLNFQQIPLILYVGSKIQILYSIDENNDPAVIYTGRIWTSLYDASPITPTLNITSGIHPFVVAGFAEPATVTDMSNTLEKVVTDLVTKLGGKAHTENLNYTIKSVTLTGTYLQQLNTLCDRYKLTKTIYGNTYYISATDALPPKSAIFQFKSSDIIGTIGYTNFGLEFDVPFTHKLANSRLIGCQVLGHQRYRTSVAAQRVLTYTMWTSTITISTFISNKENAIHILLRSIQNDNSL